MKNTGLTIGMVAIGLGLMSIGFNLNGNQAVATPAAANAGPGEPTIVWYDSHMVEGITCSGTKWFHTRAWSDGTIEAKQTGVIVDFSNNCGTPCQGVVEDSTCSNTQGWVVISSPNEGLNAAADINFDERVDAADLGQMLAAWGDAPRNDYPPSDCPLGLIP